MDSADDEVRVLGLASVITAWQTVDLATTAPKVHDASSQVAVCETGCECPDIIGLRRALKSM
jgi:hypothetical protein